MPPPKKDLVLAVLKDIRTELRSTNERLDATNERLDGVVVELRGVKAEVSAQREAVNTLAQRVDGLERRELDIIAALHAIKDLLAETRVQLANKVQEIDRRVGVLESRSAQH
jgi:archaellum component FlaC